MATNIITCSIPIELAEFLAENPQISPSKVLQMKLFQMRDDENNLKERTKAYETRLFAATSRLRRILTHCEDNNIVIPQNVLD